MIFVFSLFFLKEISFLNKLFSVKIIEIWSRLFYDNLIWYQNFIGSVN